MNLRCRIGWHKWQRFRCTGEFLVFFVRTCRLCGLREIQNANGGNEWIPLKDAFTGPVGDWERKQFIESAKEPL